MDNNENKQSDQHQDMLDNKEQEGAGEVKLDDEKVNESGVAESEEAKIGEIEAEGNLVQLFEPQKSPLDIHLIIRKIGEYLPNKYRLIARKVCKFWRSEMSHHLVAKLDQDSKLLDFIMYGHYKGEEKNIENLFTKFDLSGGMIEDKSSLEITMILQQLSSLAHIRELILPEILSSAWIPVLKIISPTIEILSICVDNFHCLFEREKPDAVAAAENKEKNPESNDDIFPVVAVEKDANDKIKDSEKEKTIFLPYLKVLKIEIPLGARNFKNPEFFEDFFSCCFNMEELEINHGSHSDEGRWNEIFDTLVTQKPYKLRILKINDASLSPFITQTFLIKLMKVSRSINLEKIQLNNTTVLSSQNITDVLRIASIYQKTRFSEINKKVNNSSYDTKQIASVKVMDGSLVFQNATINQILHHFPNLQQLVYSDYTNCNILQLEPIAPATSYQNIQKFMYLFRSDLNTGILEKITSNFPNLRCLSLKINDDDVTLNLAAIFDLSQLEEFSYLHDIRGGFKSDEEFTGIAQTYINENLKNKTVEALLEIKYEDIPKEFPSIARLTELRKLELSFKENMTETSIYFGFRQLPKLQYLSLCVSSIKRMDRRFWTIFTSDFPALETLHTFKSLENNGSFSSFRFNRPLLKLTFEKAEDRDHIVIQGNGVFLHEGSDESGSDMDSDEGAEFSDSDDDEGEGGGEDMFGEAENDEEDQENDEEEQENDEEEQENDEDVDVENEEQLPGEGENQEQLPGGGENQEQLPGGENGAGDHGDDANELVGQEADEVEVGVDEEMLDIFNDNGEGAAARENNRNRLISEMRRYLARINGRLEEFQKIRDDGDAEKDEDE